jgi:uncharacterized protein YjbI with pentapeptide repeats
MTMDKERVINGMSIHAGKDLRGIKLVRADMSNLNLEGVNFENAILSVCKFNGSNLDKLTSKTPK